MLSLKLQNQSNNEKVRKHKWAETAHEIYKQQKFIWEQQAHEEEIVEPSLKLFASDHVVGD